MTSFRQFQANRQNALKSTGPSTAEGKQRSRLNAVRHGLTAETVISALEDAEDYKAFEAAINADYDAETAVERELVLRLASLLWRLRRATAMETGLFDLQVERQPMDRPYQVEASVQSLFAVPRIPSLADSTRETDSQSNAETDTRDDLGMQLARRFLQLANRPDYALDRLSRYEAVLWRQTGRVLLTLNAMGRQKSGDRRPSFFRSWP